MRTRRQRVTAIHRGEVEIRKAGRRWRSWLDPYHLILTLPWAHFFALVAAFFVAVNLVFAFAYWLTPGSVANAHPGSFLDMLFFSVETLVTVGYGEMYPATLPGHLVSVVEMLAGMMTYAVITGLVFARFSKATARVLFSEKLVTRDFGGRRVLMARIANERHNRMLEPTAHMGLVRLEQTPEGDPYYRIHDLKLERRRNPVFELTWTLVHPIDETSPLYGWTPEALEAARSRITVSIFGHDETLAASVYALHEYSAAQIFFDHRFVDIFSDGENGKRILDLTHFHEIVPSVPDLPAKKEGAIS